MIYVFLADGFEEIEALAPVDILRRGGIEVKTVGVSGKTVTGAHGIAVTADLAAADAVTDGLDGIILPGGMPGTRNLEASETVQRFVDFAAKGGLLIGAICAAPSILGHKGLLNGRRATCFPGFEDTLAGARLIDEPTVTDGAFVTGRGAGAALEFGFALLAFLNGEESARTLRRSMCCVEADR